MLQIRPREYRVGEKDWQAGRIETYVQELNLTDKNKDALIRKIALECLTFD